MEKYIAVVNHRMDNDEVDKLISRGVAGALFQISNQNYTLAADLINQIQELSRKYNRPISIIQDVSEMTDPLDLEFGLKSGVHWVATDKPEHVKLAQGLDKLAGVIFKGRNLPKGVRVDSVMADGFLDPDAEVMGSRKHIKHLISEHPNQKLVDSLMQIAAHAGSSAIAVSDLDLAKSLSFRRANKKIVFAPKNRNQAAKGSLFWGVHPMFSTGNIASALRNSKLMKKGERVLDAINSKHANIFTL